MQQRFKQFLFPEDAEDPIIQTELRKANMIRALIAMCGALFFSMAIVSILYNRAQVITPVEIEWKSSIIKLNLSVIIANLLLIVIGFYLFRFKSPLHPLYRFLPLASLMVFGMWGIAGTVIHQMIAWTVIPFVLVSFIFVLFVVRPITLFYFFILLYIAYYLFIPIHQTNPNYIVLSRVLGLAVLMVSYCFSLLSWNNALTRIRQYRQMTLQAEELAEANASKNKFISILSHDLKGPVAISLSLAELLSEGDLEKEEQKETFQLFHAGLQNISDLLHQLLLWGNNQTGKLTFEPEPTVLKTLVDEDILLLKSLFTQKQISVKNTIEEHIMANLDHNMMHTVVRNLLSNAIKFTREGGRIVFSAQYTASSLLITIEDSGVGISPARQLNLFDLSTKNKTAGTNDESGTGLGLILCKEFVAKHKGTIALESEEGKGSRFTITLPIE